MSFRTSDNTTWHPTTKRGDGKKSTFYKNGLCREHSLNRNLINPINFHETVEDRFNFSFLHFIVEMTGFEALSGFLFQGR